jgi:hypothetical protein
MSTSKIFRLSALAAIASGICIITGKGLAFLPNPQAGEILDFFSPLFGLFAFIGVYLWQQKESGFFGWVAFIVAFIGLALIVSLDYFGAFIRPYIPTITMEQIMEGPTGIVATISGLIFLVGEVLFAISVLRVGKFSRIASVLFMIGFIPVPLIEVFPFSIVAIGSVLAGIGIIWWGISLWSFANLDMDGMG